MEALFILETPLFLNAVFTSIPFGGPGRCSLFLRTRRPKIPPREVIQFVKRGFGIRRPNSSSDLGNFFSLPSMPACACDGFR